MSVSLFLDVMTKENVEPNPDVDSILIFLLCLDHVVLQEHSNRKSKSDPAAIYMHFFFQDQLLQMH